MHCCCFARITASTLSLIPYFAIYGSLQDGSRAVRVPRTLLQKTVVADLFANGPLVALQDPPPITDTLSYVRRPLMVFDPQDIVPMPLYITLGESPRLLSLGVEAVAFDSGPDRAKEYAAALTAALRLNVGVSRAPYWGATFEGKACHKIGRRLAAVGDVLDGFVPQSIPTNVGPTPYWAHVAETCIKFAVGQFSGRVSMSNVHAALPTEVNRVKTRTYLRPIQGPSRWPRGQRVANGASIGNSLALGLTSPVL